MKDLEKNLAFSQNEKLRKYEDFWKYVASALDNKKAKILLDNVLPENHISVKDDANVIPFKKSITFASLD